MPSVRPDNPLIVQSDHSVLVEVDSPRYAAARDVLARFAELVKSPEHVHTYRITPLSIWNACASGAQPEWIVENLREYAKYPVPEHIAVDIHDQASRYGRLHLTRDEEGLVLTADDEPLAEEISRSKHIIPLLKDRLSPCAFRVEVVARGRIKQALVKIGFPAEDLAGYTEGTALPLRLCSDCASGPVLTGTTGQARRDKLYADFKAGRLSVLAVSKVANFAVDLPDAAVAIQVSGTFGSRQEEAQRLGRILRPKPGRNQAHFYTLVSRDTVEQDFALKRQLFLCEQGYEYRIVEGEEVDGTG
jgi:hypothetical protein